MPQAAGRNVGTLQRRDTATRLLVKEVVKEVKSVTGIDFPVKQTDRWEGDPPALVADSSLIRKELGWKPRYDDLAFIIRTAWEWEKKLYGRDESR